MLCAAAVVTKARDTVEPVVMTQIVTKAKEVGKFAASNLISFLPLSSLHVFPSLSYLLFFGFFRSVKDLYPGWCLFDRVRALPAPELVRYSLATEETQAEAEAEDH